MKGSNCTLGLQSQELSTINFYILKSALYVAPVKEAGKIQTHTTF